MVRPGATAIPIALLYILDGPLFLLLGRTITPGTTGGYTLGAMLPDLLAALRDWPAWMVRAERISSHMAISPPGWPLLYAVVGQTLDRLPTLAGWLAAPLRDLQCHHVEWMQLSDGRVASAWLGIASPLWAALSLLPLYDAARRPSDEALARRALSWWAVVPSLSLFTGTLTTPYPLLSSIALWLLVRGLPRRRAPWLIAAGAVTAVGILFSFSLLPLALTWALFAALEAWTQEEALVPKIRQLAVVAAWCCMGAGGVYLLYALLAGHTPWDVFSASMTFHLGHIDRPYWPWLALHTWDYMLFLGPPLLALSLAAVPSWRRSAAARLSLATGVTLLALVVSGTGRGETGRIWLLFMPLSLIGAAEVLRKKRFAQRTTLALAQAAWLLVLATVLRPVGHTLTPPPTYAAPPSSASEHLAPPNSRVGKALQLEGWEATQEDDSLLLALRWRVSQRITRAYRFSALLVSPEGALPRAVDWEPLKGRLPTTCWYGTTTAEVVDRVALPLGEDWPAGDWWLSLSVYELGADDAPLRVPVRGPDDQASDQIGLGPIRVD